MPLYSCVVLGLFPVHSSLTIRLTQWPTAPGGLLDCLRSQSQKVTFSAKHLGSTALEGPGSIPRRRGFSKGSSRDLLRLISWRRRRGSPTAKGRLLESAEHLCGVVGLSFATCPLDMEAVWRSKIFVLDNSFHMFYISRHTSNTTFS